MLTRRVFILMVATWMLASPLAPRPAAAAGPRRHGPIGLLVDGTGLDSARMVAAIRRVPDFHLVGVVGDRSAARRFVQATRENGQTADSDMPPVFTNLNDALSSLHGKVDVVHVATPTENHFADAKKAILAGVGVLSQAPAAMSPEQVAFLTEAAKQMGAPFLEAQFPRLWFPKVRELLKRPGMGEPTFVVAGLGVSDLDLYAPGPAGLAALARGQFASVSNRVDLANFVFGGAPVWGGGVAGDGRVESRLDYDYHRLNQEGVRTAQIRTGPLDDRRTQTIWVETSENMRIAVHGAWGRDPRVSLEALNDRGEPIGKPEVYQLHVANPEARVLAEVARMMPYDGKPLLESPFMPHQASIDKATAASMVFEPLAQD